MPKPILYYPLAVFFMLIIELVPASPPILVAIGALYHVGLILGVPSILIRNAEKVSKSKNSQIWRFGLVLLTIIYALLMFGLLITDNLNNYIPTYTLVFAIVIVLTSHFYILWKANYSLLSLENKIADKDRLIWTLFMFITLPIFYVFLYRRYMATIPIRLKS